MTGLSLRNSNHCYNNNSNHCNNNNSNHCYNNNRNHCYNNDHVLRPQKTIQGDGSVQLRFVLLTRLPYEQAQKGHRSVGRLAYRPATVKKPSGAKTPPTSQIRTSSFWCFCYLGQMAVVANCQTELECTKTDRVMFETAVKNEKKHPFTQPTNQPSSQPANQPTSQPANQPTNKPTNQQTNKPTNQLVSSNINNKLAAFKHVQYVMTVSIIYVAVYKNNQS